MGLLPTKKSIPKQFYNEYAKVRFGESGEGKTSQAIQEENSVLIQFEEGDKALSCYKVNLIKEAIKKYGDKMKGKFELWKVKVWEIFIETVREILEGEHNFENIVVDSGDRAYDFRMLNFKFTEGRHPSNKVNGKSDYGAGWSLFNEGFKSPFYDLKESGYGLDVICHAGLKTRDNIKGEEVSKIVPNVGGQIGEWFVDEFDIVIFHDRDTEGNRVLKVDNDGNFKAKQRLKFKEPVISAGNSAEEGYKNFKKAFKEAINANNKKLGITDEMIENYYNRKEKEEKLQEVKDKIISTCQDKKITPNRNSKLLKKEMDIESVNDFSNVDEAKKYLEFIKQYNV